VLTVLADVEGSWSFSSASVSLTSPQPHVSQPASSVCIQRWMRVGPLLYAIAILDSALCVVDGDESVESRLLLLRSSD